MPEENAGPMMPTRRHAAETPQRRRMTGRAIARLGTLLALTALLAACGGGGGGGGGGSPGGTTGGGSGAAAYFVSGLEGVDHGSGLSLAAVNPVTGQASILATTSPQSVATIAQWTAAGGTATRAGNRYRVWVGPDNFLHSADLAVVSGATVPVVGQLSTLSVASTSTCNIYPTTVLNDYANPANSALVYNLAGGCGGATDQFSVVPLSATAGTAPSAPSHNEPVDAVRDATGAITQVLFVQHGAPATVAGAPSATATPTTFGAPLNGVGINNPGTGDFQSLGVVAQASGAVWLYRDVFNIYAVNLANTSAGQVIVYTAVDNDTINGPAIVDGTTAYVGLSDNTHNTNKIVRIDTTNLTSAEIVTETPTYGIRVLGVAGSNVLYLLTTGTGSALCKVGKASTGLTAGATLATTIAGQTSVESSPVIVGSGIYYTIDNTATNPMSTQAYYVDATGGSAVAVGASGSQVLGGVLATPASSLNPGTPAYASAVIALLTTSTTDPYAGAAIAGFAGGSTAAVTMGTLPMLQSDTYYGVALSEGPLQAGVPALVLVSGSLQSGAPAQDMLAFTPGSAGSLTPVTNNLQ